MQENTTSRTTALVKTLFAIWLIVATWLLLRASIIETANQTSALALHEAVNLRAGRSPQTGTTGIERLRAAPFNELRLAIARTVVLGLLFYAVVLVARRISLRPWSNRLFQLLAVIGAIVLAFVVAVPSPVIPRSPPSQTSSDDSDQPLSTEARDSRGRPSLAGFFPAHSGRFALRDLDDRPVTLSVDRPGRFVLVDFWASWCAPCLRKLPESRAQVAELARIAPVDVFMISLDRSPADALRAMGPPIETAKYLYTEGREWDHEIVKAFRVTTIPHTVFVLPDGRNYPVDLADPAWASLVKAVMTESATGSGKGGD